MTTQDLNVIRRLRADTNAGFASQNAQVQQLSADTNAGFASANAQVQQLSADTNAGFAAANAQVAQATTEIRNDISRITFADISKLAALIVFVATLLVSLFVTNGIAKSYVRSKADWLSNNPQYWAVDSNDGSLIPPVSGQTDSHYWKGATYEHRDNAYIIVIGGTSVTVAFVMLMFVAFAPRRRRNS